jgi:hypothetical protein
MAGKTMFRFIVLIIINQFLFSCSESKCEQDITNCFENALLEEFKQTGKDDLGYKYLKSHFTKDPLSNRIIISSKSKVFYAYPSNEGWYAQEENNIQKYSLNELGHFLGDELLNENHNKQKEDSAAQLLKVLLILGYDLNDYLTGYYVDQNGTTKKSVLTEASQNNISRVGFKFYIISIGPGKYVFDTQTPDTPRTKLVMRFKSNSDYGSVEYLTMSIDDWKTKAVDIMKKQSNWKVVTNNK